MEKFINLSKQSLNGVLNPDGYHGFGRRGPFFEGWYYKLINKMGDQRWTIIPGVYIGKKAEDSHCFIQVMNGVTGKAYYINYPSNQFVPNKMGFHVSIGRNEFSARQIHLVIENDELDLCGDLTFDNLSLWPVTWQSPGIMGWYAWVPGMECYHGVVSLDHEIKGNLRINGRKTDFSGGRGYIEKDWGKAMPKAWIWLQCNHFSQPGISLTASIAIIPLGPLSFNGFIVGLLLNGTLYKFATYSGARVDWLDVNENEVDLRISDHKKQFQIHANRVGGGFLKAPTVTHMDRRITETLSAEIDVELSVREKGVWQQVFEDRGQYAGLEVVGNLKN
jgi:tocopherol cyclase